jgi:hypothetical protein
MKTYLHEVYLGHVHRAGTEELKAIFLWSDMHPCLIRHCYTSHVNRAGDWVAMWHADFLGEMLATSARRL